MDCIKELKKLTLLFVEDELVIRKELEESFKILFYDVISVGSCTEALKAFDNYTINVIISDISMPSCSGLNFVEKIRQLDSDIPIILLTAHSDQQTLLKAVNLDINGYLIKPLNLADFLKSMEKIIQKNFKKGTVSINDSLSFDIATHTLYQNGEIVNLGKKEQDILALFIKHKNKVLSKDMIVHHVWFGEDVSDSALKSLMLRMRRKLGTDIFISVSSGQWKLAHTM